MLDLTAFAALIKRKRGAAKLTQETLALDVFNDPARKADISRIENGKTTPHESTIQKLCVALKISDAEMEPIRQSRGAAAQLDAIPTLSREELQNLSLRFGIADALDAPDSELRRLLTLKAEEYRDLKREVGAINEDMKRLANLKASAQDAIDRVDLDEVENILSMVQETELEEAAKTAELRANNALLRGKDQQAFDLLESAANSFGAIGGSAKAERKILRYSEIFYKHGLRYGGHGLRLASDLIAPELTETLKSDNPTLWSGGQNNRAAALRNQGTRTGGPEGADLMAQAVTAYREALQVYTRADHPVEWATTQNNLAIALRNQGTRTGGPEGADLMAQAVTAYRDALQVRTRADHPVQWAMTQNNLGAALRIQGSGTNGPDGADLLAQSVTAYRDALQVYTRADHPVDWAMTQNNLAIALQQQGTRTSGADGAELLAQAVTAFRDALQVRTRADHPVDWAITQKNIAITFQSKAAHDSATDPHADLHAALAAVDDALTVFDPVHLSYEHASATRARDEIRAEIAKL